MSRWIDQTTFKPEVGEGAGNCMQAALASVLGLALDDVPHFAALPDANAEDGEGRRHWFLELERWLADRGLGLGVSFLTEGGSFYVSPGAFALASGKSPRGDFNHIVVVDDTGQAVHDPHPSRAGLDGLAKEIWFLVPLDPAREKGEQP